MITNGQRKLFSYFLVKSNGLCLMYFCIIILINSLKECGVKKNRRILLYICSLISGKYSNNCSLFLMLLARCSLDWAVYISAEYIST